MNEFGLRLSGTLERDYTSPGQGDDPGSPAAARMIRTIIADDEPLVRKKLRAALESEGDIDIVAECGNGNECIAAVKNCRPDLLMLDVQMPEVDGFDVLRSISAAEMPIVVFVTAHDQYAIRAFETHALDYVLKPFDRARLQSAIHRVRGEVHKLERNQLADRALGLLADLKPENRKDPRLWLRCEGRIVALDVAEIDWIQASLNYVVLYAGGHSYRTRETIGNILERLDPETFVRIHRSIIVNVTRIKELVPCNSAEYVVVLKNGRELSCSRSYRASLQRLFEHT